MRVEEILSGDASRGDMETCLWRLGLHCLKRGYVVSKFATNSRGLVWLFLCKKYNYP